MNAGFTKDPGRCNVAMTRAKEVFWMLGGPLSYGTLSPFPKLKVLMGVKGQVHRFQI
jgi:superfamily I DNA and/or RNA helicase